MLRITFGYCVQKESVCALHLGSFCWMVCVIAGAMLTARPWWIAFVACDRQASRGGEFSTGTRMMAHRWWGALVRSTTCYSHFDCNTQPKCMFVASFQDWNWCVSNVMEHSMILIWMWVSYTCAQIYGNQLNIQMDNYLAQQYLAELAN